MFGNYYGAGMGKPKKLVTHSGSRAVRGVVIAPKDQTEEPISLNKKYETKGKDKSLSSRNPPAIRMHDST